MPAHMLSFGRRGDYSLVSEMLARTDHSRRIVRGTIVGLNMKLRSPDEDVKTDPRGKAIKWGSVPTQLALKLAQ